MLDRTKDYTRYMLRNMLKYDKPYIVTGIYQKHRRESKRVTFTYIHPFIPGLQNKETYCLTDHAHIFVDKLSAVCPEWRDLLVDGKKYCIVCYSDPYKSDGVQRCGIKPTLDGHMAAIMEYDKLQDELVLYQPLIERTCVDWNTFMGGRWLKRNEFAMHSANQNVQDNCKYKNKVLRQKKAEKKRRQISRSVWRVINMKVS